MNSVFQQLGTAWLLFDSVMIKNSKQRNQAYRWKFFFRNAIYWGKPQNL